MEAVCAATVKESLRKMIIVVVIAVNKDGYREALGGAEVGRRTRLSE